MDTRTLIYVIIGVFGAIIGVYVWVAKHISNSKKHPCKDDIVFEDVCEERGKRNEAEHNRLDDCIEAAIERSNEQHAELKEDIKSIDKKLDRLLEK